MSLSERRVQRRLKAITDDFKARHQSLVDVEQYRQLQQHRAVAQAWDAWLDPGLDGPAAVELLVPLPSRELTVRPANPVVNSVDNDGPECLSDRSPEMPSLQTSFDL